MKDKQVEYYDRRAKEYEKIYDKTERQNDQEKIKDFLAYIAKTKSVLEIGCGTGYWTQYISISAKSILATDINEAMLELAEQKNYHCTVSIKHLDYEEMNDISEKFDLIFAGFVISHIRKESLRNFLSTWISKLNKGGEILFVDNRFVEGNSTPISRVDESGNSFQNRILENGSVYEVLKNFLSEDEWNAAGQGLAEVEIINWEYFYAARLRVKMNV